MKALDLQWEAPREGAKEIAKGNGMETEKGNSQGCGKENSREGLMELEKALGRGEGTENGTAYPRGLETKYLKGQEKES